MLIAITTRWARSAAQTTRCATAAEAARLGAHVATLPPGVLRQLGDVLRHLDRQRRAKICRGPEQLALIGEQVVEHLLGVFKIFLP